jgi:ribosomal protein L37E
MCTECGFERKTEGIESERKRKQDWALKKQG